MGPLEKLGGFHAQEVEASAIVAGTLSTYPLAESRAFIKNGWRQLLKFRTGAELGAHAGTESLSRNINEIFGPVIYQRYLNSKQIIGTILYESNLINSINFAII